MTTLTSYSDHYIAEILLKEALNTITQTTKPDMMKEKE
jgi:hypothetical protein